MFNQTLIILLIFGHLAIKVLANDQQFESTNQFCTHYLHIAILDQLADAKVQFKKNGGGFYLSDDLYPSSCKNKYDKKLVWDLESEIQSSETQTTIDAKTSFRKNLILAALQANFLLKQYKDAKNCSQSKVSNNSIVPRNIILLSATTSISQRQHFYDSQMACKNLWEWYGSEFTSSDENCSNSFNENHNQIDGLKQTMDKIYPRHLEEMVEQDLKKIAQFYPMLFVEGQLDKKSELFDTILESAKDEISDLIHLSPNDYQIHINEKLETIYKNINHEHPFNKYLNDWFKLAIDEIDQLMNRVCNNEIDSQFWLDESFSDHAKVNASFEYGDEGLNKIEQCIENVKFKDKAKTVMFHTATGILAVASILSAGLPLILEVGGAGTLLTIGAASGAIGFLLGSGETIESNKKIHITKALLYANLRSGEQLAKEKRSYYINASLSALDLFGSIGDGLSLGKISKAKLFEKLIDKNAELIDSKNVFSHIHPNVKKRPLPKNQDEFLKLGTEDDIYTNAHNQHFIQLDRNKPKKTIFFETENSVLKLLNDYIIKDKSIVQSATSLFKEVQADILFTDPQLSKLAVHLKASYGDYKSTKFAFNYYSGIEKDLEIWYQKTGIKFEEAGAPFLEKFIDENAASNLKRWFVAGASNISSETTNMASRWGRLEEGQKIQWFDKSKGKLSWERINNLKELIPQNLNELILKIEYQRNHLEQLLYQDKNLFELGLLQKTKSEITTLTPDLIQSLRRIKQMKNAPSEVFDLEIKQILEKKYGVEVEQDHPIIQYLREFYFNTDRLALSPLLETNDKIQYGLTPGSSIDLPGAGAKSIIAVQEAIGLANKRIFGTDNLETIVASIKSSGKDYEFLADTMVSFVKDGIESVADEIVGIQKRINHIVGQSKSSGDDMITRQLTYEDLKNFHLQGQATIRIVNHETAKLGESQFINVAESVEKSIRDFYISPNERKIFDKINFAIYLISPKDGSLTKAQMKIVLTGDPEVLAQLPSDFHSQVKNLVEDANSQSENAQLIFSDTHSVIQNPL